MKKVKKSKRLSQRYLVHVDKRVAEIRQRKKDFLKKKKEN